MSAWKQQQNIGGRRTGVLATKSGSMCTPFFMPDATRAAVRGVSSGDLGKAGIGALVVNTYHLLLQPGENLVKRAGGVHAFMHWDKPILSDSGGYQVYSLIHRNPELGRITEEGAEFRSVLDGSKHLLTPERAIQIQFDLGVDMMVVLDDPRPNSAPETEVAEAVERTLRWAERSRREYEQQVASRGLREAMRPLLFGVVQGGMFREQRRHCAEGLVAIGFDGYGFGGRHIDDEGNFLEDIVRYTASLLPEESARFALGIGTPDDIVRCHRVGWDMFDCVIPTREGRHGRLFIWNEQSQLEPQNSIKIQNSQFDSFYKTININNEQFKEDFAPVDPTCDCELCRNHTRAYLKHLFKVGDPLALRLASLHNLRFYMRLMERLRA
ncbi:MAG: tRNA guanosine(34) transglycosylase Tgt [Candidatus Moraniibacteriota bacterium]